MSTRLFGADATFSLCGAYRYTLSRTWDEGRPPALFVMLNPSTADAEQEDPTIRRCLRFARDWGYGGLLVGNLFAFRATDPAELARAGDPVGPGNDSALLELRARARDGVTIAAWGAHRLVAKLGRGAHVMDLLGGLHVLGLTKQCAPRHPLYVAAATRPTPWTIA